MPHAIKKEKVESKTAKCGIVGVSSGPDAQDSTMAFRKRVRVAEEL